MSESEDAKRERHYLAVRAELNPGETAVERTLDNLAVVASGWFRVRNEKGTFAYFPNVPNYQSGSAAQHQLESEWGERAIAMHDQQTLVMPDAKPTENAMLKRVVRAD